MRKFFNYDNPIFQTVSRLADLAILGLLFLACCLPVVTVGASASALFKAAYDLTLERGSGVVKNFFRAFRDNFKQATGAWLLALLVFVSLLCDWFLLKLYFEGAAFTVLACIVIVLALGLIGFLCYFFALIARYENTLREHARNALILSIRYFYKTLPMILIQLLPLLMFLCMPAVLVQTLLFWIMFCPGFSVQATVYLLRPIFDRLEQGAEGSEETASKDELAEEK